MRRTAERAPQPPGAGTDPRARTTPRRSALPALGSTHATTPRAPRAGSVRGAGLLALALLLLPGGLEGHRLLAAAEVVAPAGQAGAEPTAAGDLAAARAVFERNLAAIAAKDRDAYLATYLDAETLARTGPEGPSLGFADLAAQTGAGWPDVFDAQDLRLVPVQPGVVYGTYRYRVAYAGDEHRGLSERLFVATPEGWRIAVTTAFDAPPGTPPPPRALVGATLVDGSGGPPVPDAVVLVRGGEIECAGSRAACPVPEGVGVVDATGRWITPGLVDAHVHFSQTGWADGRPDALDVRASHPYPRVIAELAAHPERFFRAYLCSGVTAVFDVGGYPWTIALAERAEGDTLAPHVAAAGPLLSTLDHWLNLPAERQFLFLADEAAAGAGVDDLAARGADAVKVWFITGGDGGKSSQELEPRLAAAGAAADAAGLPLIVHATDLAEAKAALRAGAEVLVHSVWDRPVDDEFLALAKANGTVYVPTLTVSRGYVRLYRSAATGEPPPVDDPRGCVDAGTRARLAETATLELAGLTPERVERQAARTAEQEAIAAANLARVHAAGIAVAVGTDAGNPLTLHGPAIHAELEAMQAAGLTPMEVLTAATRGGARAMNRPDLGTLEPGNPADLLLLTEDPTRDVRAFRALDSVMRGGVLREVGELAAKVPGS